MAEGALAAAVTGLALAVSFNPMASLVGAALAAALLARAERPGAGIVVLAAAWLLGDGLRVLARARDAFDGVGPLVPGAPVATWVALGLWALGGALVGYALPAWAGAFVGRRVTHGTGWLAAATIAAVSSAGLAVLAGTLPLA